MRSPGASAVSRRAGRGPAAATESAPDRDVDHLDPIAHTDDDRSHMPAVDDLEPEGRRVPVRGDRRHLRRRAGHLAQGPVHEHHRLVRAGAAAPGRAQRAERDRAARGGARAGAEPVGQRDPDAVEVLDDVVPVARHLVAREHVAGDLTAADPQDPRRQQALLDLGRGQRPDPALGAGERVRVPIGERDRRRGLSRELGQRAARTPEGEQHARRPPSQPERDDLDARAIRQLAPERGQAFGVELGADREWHLDLVGEAIGSGDAQEMRAVDVDHVERHGHLRDPLCLGRELLGEHRGRHDVEDVDPFEGHGSFASQPSRGERLLGVLQGLGGPLLADRVEQAGPIGEVAVEGGPGHAGRRREIGDRRLGGQVEQPAAGVDDPRGRPLCAGALAGHG